MIYRILISLLIGLLAGAALSEITFSFLKETARPPESIALTISDGTAEQVARGKSPPSIPINMIFVVGDTLIVKNEDAVPHQLGPLWIPAGTSASLVLGATESVSYECSFEPSKYVNLDVREALTPGTRIYGIVFAGLPLGVLIALYSLTILYVPPQKSM